jgi:hypothetical protein
LLSHGNQVWQQADPDSRCLIALPFNAPLRAYQLLGIIEDDGVHFDCSPRYRQHKNQNPA